MKNKRHPNKLTAKQKAYADNILSGKNATQAVIDAGYQVANRHTAEVIGSENLLKPEIMNYLTNHAKEAEQTMVQVMQYSKLNGMDNPAYATVAIRAAADILDRTHGRAVQQVETRSTGIQLNISLSGATPVENTSEQQ